MWFTKSIPTKPSLEIRRYSLQKNRKNKKDGKFYWKVNSLPSNNSTYTIPASWSLVLLKRKSSPKAPYLFYVSNNFYFFTFVLTQAVVKFRIDYQANTVHMTQKFWNFCFNHYLASLKSELHLLYLPFFTKMKFKGKGYYVYKNFRNTIAPKFGYYHRVYVYAFHVTVKFLSKTSVLIFGFSKKDIRTVGHLFKSKKAINVFTGRGVRFARQIVYRKTGKVSSYR